MDTKALSERKRGTSEGLVEWLSAAVGLPIGHGIPDLDISLFGIGGHRNFAFHSALPAAAAYGLLKRFLTKPRSRLARRLAGCLAAGLAAGNGVHLAVDVFQPHAVEFPLVGSLVNGTLIDDNLWLGGNAVACFALARECWTATMSERNEGKTSS